MAKKKSEKAPTKPRSKKSKSVEVEPSGDRPMMKFYCPFTGKEYMDFVPTSDFKFKLRQNGIPIKPTKEAQENLEAAQRKTEEGYGL